MDVNSNKWLREERREFEEKLSKDCKFRNSWFCNKSQFACKDYLCHIVKFSANITEVRKKFAQQKLDKINPDSFRISTPN